MMSCGAAPVYAADHPDAISAAPVLVELFTSEGCSSCPPADRLLQQLNGRESGHGARIIGISEHVTYWDHLGWRDPFSSDTVTERQNAYGTRFHLDSVYTPQMVVNGRAQLVGSDAAGVLKAIEAQGAAGPAHLQIRTARASSEGLAILVGLDGVPKDSADLYVVIAEDMASTPVRHGENSGRTLTHVSIARSLSRVAVADGNAEMTLRIPAVELRSTEGSKRHVIVFAQGRHTGPVLAVDSTPL